MSIHHEIARCVDCEIIRKNSLNPAYTCAYHKPYKGIVHDKAAKNRAIKNSLLRVERDFAEKLKTRLKGVSAKKPRNNSETICSAKQKKIIETWRINLIDISKN